MHLQDPNIPCWVLKVKGESFYVNHITISKGVGFSTKETPENPHTKASIKVHGKCRIYKNADGSVEVLIEN